MSEFSVKAPTIPIPFHEPLTVVAIVDREDVQTRQLLDPIAAEKFEVEVCDRFDRDVSEDAAVGAYIALIDGEDRRERARSLVRAVRAIGFGMPLRALADSHRISDLGLIYPPGIGVVFPGERWDERAQPMLDYFLTFQESFNRFPGFNYEVQGVYQERVDGRIRFHTYVVRE